MQRLYHNVPWFSTDFYSVCIFCGCCNKFLTKIKSIIFSRLNLLSLKVRNQKQLLWAETKVCRVSWKGSFLVWSSLASGVHLYSLDYSTFLSILLLLLLAGLPINSSNSVSFFSEASGDDKGSIWIGSPLHLKILDHISSTSLSHNMTFIGLQNQDMEYLGGYFIAHDTKLYK